MSASNAALAAECSNLGVRLIAGGLYDEAISALESAIKLDPQLAEAHANLGQAYRLAGRYAEAMQASRAALALRPAYLEACLNLAVAASASGAYDAAAWANRRALEIDPQNAQAACNLAAALHARGEYAAAIAACERAIALRPEYAAAHANLGMSLLTTGDFARGWPEYAWLRRIPEKREFYPYLDRLPQWSGEPFAGKRLLVTREQGFGDVIQMARYLRAVKTRGGRVILESPQPLAELLAEAGADEVRIVDEVGLPRDDVDLHVPLMALPAIFGYDGRAAGAAATPYLFADARRVARWAPRIGAPGRRRIGLVWSGNPGHVHDRERSAGFEHFTRLGAREGVAWFSLQKGRDEARSALGGAPLAALGPLIEDFSDTAAILAQLDLLIAVDTAAAHLAGALGRPVWLLLPFVPDWRWGLGSAQTPWYPAMRLFRQPRPGDWASVLDEVERALFGDQLVHVTQP